MIYANKPLYYLSLGHISNPLTFAHKFSSKSKKITQARGRVKPSSQESPLGQRLGEGTQGKPCPHWERQIGRLKANI